MNLGPGIFVYILIPDFFFFHSFSLDDTAAALMRNPQILAALQVCHYHHSSLLTNNFSL